MRLVLAPVLAASLLLSGCLNATEEKPKPVLHGEPSSAVPDGWRAESYGSVTLLVPDDWKLGYSPLDDGDRSDPELIWCGGVDGSYVGRPRMGSDLCNGDPIGSIRDTGFNQEAVWFDSRLPVGEVGHGIPARTVAVGDSKITVAARDEAVRDRILASARIIVDEDPNGCTPTPGSVTTDEPIGEVVAFSVCAYDGRRGELLWSNRRTPAEGRALTAGWRSAPGARAVSERPRDDRVDLVLVLENKGRNRVLRWRVAPIPAVLHGPGAPVLLTPETVRPWAGDGIRAYVFGGGGGSRGLSGYFQGMLG